MSNKNKLVSYSGGIILFGALSAIIANNKSVNQLWMIVTGLLAIVCAVMAGYYMRPRAKK